jgi:hypothetical protein
MLRRTGQWARSALTNENVDLYLMALAAFAFTILGATGIADVQVLMAMTLAVLTTLSISLIRSRKHFAQIAAAAHADPLSVLLADFPEELVQRRANASDLLYIGVSMRRTAPTSLRAFRRILSAGGRIRVLLVDPTDDSTLTQALRRGVTARDIDALRSTIMESLNALTGLDPDQRGKLEIRVARSFPAIGFSAVDAESRDGLLVAQHYEYRAQAEASPIFRLTARDGYWYSHFLEEAERMWADGVPWPLPLDVTVARMPRPAFVQEFGPALISAIDDADDLFITGVARNTLLTASYAKLEKKLKAGAKLRFLLVEPDSPAVDTAAERYYVERSSDVLRVRINHSLRLLSELQRSTGGHVEVRLTTYPMGIGIVAADTTLFAEYFTYQAVGEPKFVVTPADGWVYTNLLGEAEALWAGATPAP